MLIYQRIITIITMAIVEQKTNHNHSDTRGRFLGSS